MTAPTTTQFVAEIVSGSFRSWREMGGPHAMRELIAGFEHRGHPIEKIETVRLRNRRCRILVTGVSGWTALVTTVSA